MPFKAMFRGYRPGFDRRVAGFFHGSIGVLTWGYWNEIWRKSSKTPSGWYNAQTAGHADTVGVPGRHHSHTRVANAAMILQP
jgi:hypothetical protein